jgi:hypothetical protein
MRSFLTLSLLTILCASTSAATLHHAVRRHHATVRPSLGLPGYAIPGSAYAAVPPAVHYNDTPIYNDPSKFGGSAALPQKKQLGVDERRLCSEAPEFCPDYHGDNGG